MEEALRADLVEPTTEDELVPWHSRCPRCDEQRMDWLVWVSIENDKVECMNCHATYTP